MPACSNDKLVSKAEIGSNFGSSVNIKDDESNRYEKQYMHLRHNSLFESRNEALVQKHRTISVSSDRHNRLSPKQGP